MMWGERILLWLLGLTSGMAVAAGTFAFIIIIGVAPRIIGKSNTAKQVLWYENAIILGGILGNIVSVYTMMPLPVGRWFLTLFGLCSGIQVGCLAVALAEILNTFPIMFRRINLKTGLPWVITFMAIGKMIGAFWYFYKGMASV